MNVQRSGAAGPGAREIRRMVLDAFEAPELASALAGADEMTVKVSGDRALRRLNRDFLGLDEVTDVLAFPGADSYLGDLVVSWPMVRRQASEFGHPELIELRLLIVHGLLHLLGWDHGTPEEETEMTRLTHAVLRRSGVDVAEGRL